MIKGQKISFNDLDNPSFGNSRTVIAFSTNNIGNRTLLFSEPLAFFHQHSKVANFLEVDGDKDKVTQRGLNTPHAKKLASYLLKGLVQQTKNKAEIEGEDTSRFDFFTKFLGKHTYVSIQPIVCNIRGINEVIKDNILEPQLDENNNLVAYKVNLPEKLPMFVIDGQHRRAAIEILFEFFRNPTNAPRTKGGISVTKKGNILSGDPAPLNVEELAALEEVEHTAQTEVTIQIEAHLGLDIAQERQAFYDYNHLGRKVTDNDVQQFDSSNALNIFVEEHLINSNENIDCIIVEKAIPWSEDEGQLTRKNILTICSNVFFNKSSPKNINLVHFEERKAEILLFFKALTSIDYFCKPGVKKHSLIGQMAMIQSLCKVMFELSFSANADIKERNRFLREMHLIDFRHDNALWGFNELEQSKREENVVLLNYLGSRATSHMSLGEYKKDSINTFDTAFRLGNHINDIKNPLSDMIRYTLKLPVRISRKTGNFKKAD